MRIPISIILLTTFLVVGHFALGQNPSCLYEQLFEASKTGDVEEVKSLLQEGIDVNTEDVYGETALFYAVGWNHKEVVELLVSAGADVNHRSTRNGSTALMAINDRDNSECLQVLLNNGADVNVRMFYQGETALFYAAFIRNIPVIKLLLNYGANVNDADQNGDSVLLHCLTAHYPLQKDPFETIKVLLAAGADVNQRGRYGWTPAHAAFNMRSLEALRLIAPKVEGKFWKGAEEDFRKAADNPELVQLYLDAGADVNAGGKGGWDLLMEAIRTGSAQSIQILIKAGADVNSTDSNGVSPIQFAVGRGIAETVRVLISKGANIENLKNDYLKQSLLAGNFDIAKILEDAGAYLENQKELTLKGQIYKSIQTGHRIVAEEFFRTLEKEFPDGDRRVEIFQLGNLYFREALYNESIKIHQQMIQNYPGSSSVPFAYYQIAQAYKKMGVESKMAKALEDSLSYVVTKENSTGYEFLGVENDTREAQDDLARYYMKTGNWSGALDLLEKWFPWNDCLGTLRDEKARMIIECKSHLQQ